MDDNTLVTVMIETRKAIENADAIAAVPGIDCLLVGSDDLSMEMGIPVTWRIPRSRGLARRSSPPVASTASGRVWAVPIVVGYWYGNVASSLLGQQSSEVPSAIHIEWSKLTRLARSLRP